MPESLLEALSSEAEGLMNCCWIAIWVGEREEGCVRTCRRRNLAEVPEDNG